MGDVAIADVLLARRFLVLLGLSKSTLAPNASKSIKRDPSDFRFLQDAAAGVAAVSGGVIVSGASKSEKRLIM